MAKGAKNLSVNIDTQTSILIPFTEAAVLVRKPRPAKILISLVTATKLITNGQLMKEISVNRHLWAS